MPIEIPAVANHELLMACLLAAKAHNIKVHVGLGHTKDAFYAEENDSNNPMNDINQAFWQQMIKSGVLVTSMEAAAIYAIAQIRQLCAIELLVTIGETWNDQPIAANHEEVKQQGVEQMIHIVKEAIKILLRWEDDPSTCPFDLDLTIEERLIVMLKKMERTEFGNIKRYKITPDTDIHEYLMNLSLDAIDLVKALNAEFKFKLSLDDIAGIARFDELVRNVDDKLEKTNS